jgi:hypothetical protein
LKEYYVEYATNAYKFKRAKAVAAAAAAAGAVGAVLVDATVLVDEDDDSDDGRFALWNYEKEKAVATGEPVGEPNFKELFEAEFEEAFMHWVAYARSIKWDKEFDMTGRHKPYDEIEDMMHLEVGKLYKRIENDPKYGLLPLMARASRGSIGALPAESYCERVLSCANLVMTTGNTLLSSAEVDMVVVLRMNRDFMKYMREKHPDLASKANTEVSLLDNAEVIV